MKRIVLGLLLTILCSATLFAQAPKKLNSGEIYSAIEKLNFLGTVLYIAAHPDDENTRMISYFANDVKARTAYLSLTRGDGGQNLVGPEIRELLGVIRTQELLAARRIDGGEQFFTRANDFGYSKHPDETLEIWNKEEVLNDVVAVIRKFKPDIIINRFNHRNPGTTHGHHTSSAMLGYEAFDLASDATYKTHLKKDELWSPKRLFFNTSWWFYGSRENFEKADKTNLISLDIGTYYKNKGLSNSEIASLSRSQHQSQGFGSTGTRGSQIEHLELLKGENPSNKEVFEGVDTSWNRIAGGRPIGELMQKIQDEYDFNNPAKSLSDLTKAYGLISNLDENHWKAIKLGEIESVIAACAGLYLEVAANLPSTTIGASNKYNFEAINRSDFNIELESVSIPSLGVVIDESRNLKNNVSHRFSEEALITESIPYSSPYWLSEKGSLGMYKVTDTEFISRPETPRTVKAVFSLNFDGQPIRMEREVIYKYNDPVKGEVYKPFEILPEVSASFEESVFIFADGSPQKISIKVKGIKDNIKGKLQLCVPEDWGVWPENQEFELKQYGEEQKFEFEVTPPNGQSEGLISPIVEIGTKSYSSKLVEIDYDYIPFQSITMPSEAKVVRLNIQKKGELIGYIHGAGDVVPTSLRQIGYSVVEINENDINPENLKGFDAVILGIRAYNTNDRAKFYQKYLHEYVESGGTLIAQYNTSRRLKVPQVGPYPLKLSRDRVTEEHSEVRITNPDHEVLNYPNKIGVADFDGWTQERGLYFPNEWDASYDAVISLNDKNETPKNGSLLLAKFGKGNFIYTGLSFFRELPAGVPGAYRLFANMLSIGKNEITTPIKN